MRIRGCNDPRRRRNPEPEGDPTMRFMIMFRNDGDSEVDVPPCLDLEEMGNFIGELQSTGVLLGYEGLKPSEKGARVRLNGGKRNVLDGPFTEAKELIAGFALVQLPSKDAAIDLAEQFLVIAGQGSAEVREAFEPDAEAAEAGAAQAVGAAVAA
jgi:hypothetical protein